jgi:predicted dehydrogenase
MKDHNISNSRRSFIKKSAGAFAAFSILPNLVSRGAIADRVRVAHIGLGGMGNAHMEWFAAIKSADITALCDLDPDHLSSTGDKLKKLGKRRFQEYTDFRSILDRKDIDAVTIATPDHWHGQIAIMAFESGKDVYGEKPLSYDIREGQLMLESLEKNKKVFQLGTQIHAGNNYHRVAEIIKSGAIGKVHTVKLWKTGYSPGLGNPKIQSAPSYWDMWLGPAPEADYFPERCHFNYRYFMDYSGGVFADFWCHIADIVWWAIDPKGLSSVGSRGEKTGEIADVPKWLECDMQFDGLTLQWTSTPPDVPGADKMGIGAWFEGDKGTLICDYNNREVTINGERMKDLPDLKPFIERSPGHQQNFIDAVRSRKQPESELSYARRMTLPMHLALISWRLGRKLEWDSVKEEFINDDEANALRSRPYRQKWNLIGKI